MAWLVQCEINDLEEEEEDDDADEEEDEIEDEAEEDADEVEEEEENAEEDVRMSEKCETRKNVREKSRRGKEIIWITCYDVSDGGVVPGEATRSDSVYDASESISYP
ncbi:hypothetical protein M8J75_003428 [Diaphorina citri]|nr:hypothetical protein M8J75_003428 [Diaphorina citri]